MAGFESGKVRNQSCNSSLVLFEFADLTFERFDRLTESIAVTRRFLYSTAEPREQFRGVHALQLYRPCLPGPRCDLLSTLPFGRMPSEVVRRQRLTPHGVPKTRTENEIMTTFTGIRVAANEGARSTEGESDPHEEPALPLCRCSYAWPQKPSKGESRRDDVLRLGWDGVSNCGGVLGRVLRCAVQTSFVSSRLLVVPVAVSVFREMSQVSARFGR